MNEASDAVVQKDISYSIKNGLILGALTALPLIGLFYLGDQVAGLPFVPFDIFDWMARILPGSVITLGIDSIVSIIDILNLGSTSTSAKLIEQLSALLLFGAAGAFLGGATTWLLNRGLSSFKAGGIVGAFAFLFVVIVEIILPLGNSSLFALLWIGILIIGWGFVNAYLNQAINGFEQSGDKQGRRRVLIGTAGGAFTLLLTGVGVGKLVGSPDTANDASEIIANVNPAITAIAQEEAYPGPGTLESSATEPETALTRTRDDVDPAPGTRSELTTNEDFYRIDINTRQPSINQEEWQLEVAGLFDKPRGLSLKELVSFPSVTQPITLSCISNRVGGDLIGTSNWTGLRLMDLLEDLGIQPAAKELMVDSVDGFFESVIQEDMMDPRTLLVYAMNGEPLPQGHGFPLRIYIPNRYGMKQPKWIKQITAVGESVLGYWVVRGWSQEARPQIVSVIDTIASDEPSADGQIPVGGIAWAGDREIQKVELQIDDGDWVEATLRTPTLSPLTWVQWRYDWSPLSGKHEFRVRATDGNGALQIEKESGVRPDGATGYHSKDVRI
jgi:DMSO/TMAO reductase YedYZ molybdopterin-dependent catalytic subunit